jgi:hypothetical protein
MKTKLIKISLTAAGLIAVTSMLFAADSPSPKDDSAEIAGLKRKVAQLEERIAKMEKKLSEKPVPAPNPLWLTPPANPPAKNDLLDQSPPPKIWGEGEVNGWKYYVVPLGADSPRK